jgi:hypothetical protein
MFGIDLGVQMDRDNVEIPIVIEKCVNAIESAAFGELRTAGLYRVSGSSTSIQKLKIALERGIYQHKTSD